MSHMSCSYDSLLISDSDNVHHVIVVFRLNCDIC